MATPDDEPMMEASHSNGWTLEENAKLDALEVTQNRAARLLLKDAAQRTGLSPFARQLYLAFRDGWWRVETSINGMRTVAEAQDRYRGQEGPLWCGTDGEWRDAWPTAEPPVAAKVGVRVAAGSQAYVTWGVAHFDEFALRNEDGSLGSFWFKMPRNQLALAAERQALRKEFARQLGGIYTPDEVVRDAATAEEAQPQAWDPYESQVMQKSAALVEAAAMEGDLTEEQREVAEVLGRMQAALAEADPLVQWERLRTLWMKTPERLRRARTPLDGAPLLGAVMEPKLREVHEAVRSLAGQQGRKVPAQRVPREAAEEKAPPERPEGGPGSNQLRKPAARKGRSSARASTKTTTKSNDEIARSDNPVVSGGEQDGKAARRRA